MEGTAGPGAGDRLFGKEAIRVPERPPGQFPSATGWVQEYLLRSDRRPGHVLRLAQPGHRQGHGPSRLGKWTEVDQPLAGPSGRPAGPNLDCPIGSLLTSYAAGGSARLTCAFPSDTAQIPPNCPRGQLEEGQSSWLRDLNRPTVQQGQVRGRFSCVHWGGCDRSSPCSFLPE